MVFEVVQKQFSSIYGDQIVVLDTIEANSEYGAAWEFSKKNQNHSSNLIVREKDYPETGRLIGSILYGR